MIPAWLWNYYEAAKAKVMAYAGTFMQNRDKILNMRDRLDRLQHMTTDPVTAAAVTQLRHQVDSSYSEQLSLEGKITDLLRRFDMADASKPSSGSLSQEPISDTLLLALGASALVVAGAVVIHTQHVNLEGRALTDIENKVITPSQWAAIKKAGSFLPSLGEGIGLGTVALVGLGLWYFFGRKGKTA